MYRLFVLVPLLTTLVACTGEGNIHLMEEEIEDAIRSCSINIERFRNSKNLNRSRRSYNNIESYPRIDSNTKQETNIYDHERRNATERNQIYVLNGTDYDYLGYGAGDAGEKLIKTIPRPALGNGSYNNSHRIRFNRNKRSEYFLGTDDSDQCLSQCVFANLQTVDSKGIPREAELWNKIQTSVNSQQSRTLLRNQLQSCFQELQTESEENGCSYSNKLDRCLMLRLSDREILFASKNNQSTYQKLSRT
ncbi:uncharacterized protein LOC119831833 [Zerene cesonia]|uniref:uncharacterized protein LOC119831833 n=1 Tax=Zerene cesonia TaxID=33412 RepID=UPI0018E58F86|nr:uncharacterized protein LOC119831833 [Zerene cesonia]